MALPTEELANLLGAEADKFSAVLAGTPGGEPPAPVQLPAPDEEMFVGVDPAAPSPSGPAERQVAPEFARIPPSLVGRATEKLKMMGVMPYSTNTLDDETVKYVQDYTEAEFPSLIDPTTPEGMVEALQEIARAPV